MEMGGWHSWMAGFTLRGEGDCGEVILIPQEKHFRTLGQAQRAGPEKPGRAQEQTRAQGQDRTQKGRQVGHQKTSLKGHIHAMSCKSSSPHPKKLPAGCRKQMVNAMRGKEQMRLQSAVRHYIHGAVMTHRREEGSAHTKSSEYSKCAGQVPADRVTICTVPVRMEQSRSQSKQERQARGGKESKSRHEEAWSTMRIERKRRSHNDGKSNPKPCHELRARM